MVTFAVANGQDSGDFGFAGPLDVNTSQDSVWTAIVVAGTGVTRLDGAGDEVGRCFGIRDG